MWKMLVDLYLKGKNVVVFGGGDEAELKVTKLLDDTPKVTIVSKRFTPLLNRLGKKGKIRIIECDLENGYESLRTKIETPSVAFLATDNSDLNRKGADFARSMGAMVCVVDTPELCDFAMPAIAKVGDVRIGISTGGRSPIVAKMLRKRIEVMLTKEDLLQLELQEYAKKQIRPKLNKFETRKKFLWKIVEDGKIQSLLKEDKIEQAKMIVDRMIERVV